MLLLLASSEAVWGVGGYWNGNSSTVISSVNSLLYHLPQLLVEHSAS